MTKLVVSERQVAIDDFETIINEVTDTEQIEETTVIRTVAVMNAPEYADKFAAADDLLRALEKAIEWLENAPFDYSNGNEAQGVDEGNYYGWKAHKALVAELREVYAKAKGEQS